MDYSSLPVQAYNLGHFLLAFVLVYVLMPRLLFRPLASASRTDGIVSMYMRMVCFVILVGYALLITKLYEALGFLGVVFIVFLVRRSRSGKHRSTVGATAMALFYDLVETRYLLKQWLRKAIPAVQAWWAKSRRELRISWSPATVEVILLLVVMAASVYVRGYDAVTSPAPAMSDGYVTLAWIKYVNERILFHDGIYPQGLYFYLATLGKFAFINLLFVLKYAGPMDTVLIVYSLYFAASRLTGQRAIGLVAAVLYGLFGHTLLGDDWARQAATNSQEFGFIFVAPTLYFLNRYIDHGDRTDYTTALAGLSVTGLTHPLAFVLCGLGCAAVVITHAVLPGPFTKGRLLRALAAGVIACGVTVAPIALGFAFHRGFNTSASDFAGSTVQQTVHPPALTWLDMVGLLALAVLVVAALVQLTRRNPRREWLIGAVFGGLVFLLYYAGGPVTQNLVLISRALDLWAVTQPLVVALAVHAVCALWRSKQMVRWSGSTLTAAGIAGAVATGGLTPIIPYKMQWPEDVEAYLHINNQFQYAGYMLVANNEEYALVLGSGYRMDIGEFVRTFDPAKPPLTKYGQHHPYDGIAPNVFLYYPNQIFEVSKSNSIYPLEAPLYAQEAKDRAALKQWLSIYEQHHPVKVYFHDAHLTVYEITADVQPQEKKYDG